MTRFYESQESSSPTITRAVANGLNNHSFDVYSFSKLQKMALRLLGQFPKELAEWAIPRVNSTSALSYNDVEGLSANDLAMNRISDYSNNEKKYSSVTIGTGMGGTTAHLSMMLGGPFLPQAFVITMKNGTMNGNVQKYCELSREIAQKITNNNDNLMSIQHYDPVHDGWLVKRVNHLRLKLIDLPEAYKTFLRERLEPGGDVVYLQGNAKWLRYRLGSRNVFQIGGWGDVSAKEFIEGSDRLKLFAKKEGLEFSHWNLDGYPLEEGPESEWGSEAGLSEALEAFCNKEGFNFVKIDFENPNDFSKLAFFAKLEQLSKDSIPPEAIVVEMFSQFDTNIVDHSAILPLWLIFNTHDSKIFLQSMTSYFPKNLPVFFSGLATFSRTPDLVQWEEWISVLANYKVINIGARKTHFPADTLALLDWNKPLEQWAKKRNSINLKTLSSSDLISIAKKIKSME